MTEGQLNRRLAADLDASFPDLLDTYGPMVLSIVRQLGDPAEAEDLTQNVFVAAYRALDRYDADRVSALALRPWLATIAKNQLRNEWRRRSRKSTSRLDDHELPSTPCAADRAVAAVTLQAAIGQLPEAQRLAVLLRHVAGLSTNEAAQVLECPTGTVKSHVSRGLAALRQALDDGTDQEEESPS